MVIFLISLDYVGNWIKVSGGYIEVLFDDRIKVNVFELLVILLSAKKGSFPEIEPHR